MKELQPSISQARKIAALFVVLVLWLPTLALAHGDEEHESWIDFSHYGFFGLTKGKANPAGAVIAQALGPLRQIVPNTEPKKTDARYLLLTAMEGDKPVLVQDAP